MAYNTIITSSFLILTSCGLIGSFLEGDKKTKTLRLAIYVSAAICVLIAALYCIWSNN